MGSGNRRVTGNGWERVRAQNAATALFLKCKARLARPEGIGCDEIRWHVRCDVMTLSVDRSVGVVECWCSGVLTLMLAGSERVEPDGAFPSKHRQMTGSLYRSFSCSLLGYEDHGGFG